MKIFDWIAVFVVVVAGANTSCSCHKLAPWEDPEVFALNKEPTHVTMIPFASMEEAQKGWDASSLQISLNGEWSFKHSPSPEARPKNFFRKDFDSAGFQRIPVPSNWEMHGYDKPVYRNAGYIFNATPDGKVPHEGNSVGSYRRTFTVPPSFKDKHVFLHFDGVASAFFVWVNGEQVGYSEDSMSPSEFDVTKLLVPGENSVAVEVYRWSDGSYLEDQDMWRLSGIFRDVYLFAAPSVFLRDFFLTAKLDDTFQNAEFRAEVALRNTTMAAYTGYTLETILKSRAADDVAKEPLSFVTPLEKLAANGEASQTITHQVVSPRLWSAEGGQQRIRFSHR